jgi:hypothetical protein
MYLLYWYKSTCFEPETGANIEGDLFGYAVYLLYWCKCTCFTGLKVQTLTRHSACGRRLAELADAVYVLYLLYLLNGYERANTDWYERTNTGRWLAKLADPSIPLDELRKVLSVLILLVQKHQY